MIWGEERSWFQKWNRCLSERLLEFLHAEGERLLLAIPDIFGSLDMYTESAADGKDRAVSIFRLFQDIWNGRDVMLIEGEYPRIGVGNRLLKDTRSVKRIIAPSENAFCIYDKIIECALSNIKEDTLALISLGPTATVLAYDLSRHGIQAIDIGQLDNEYEWSLCKAEKRVLIFGKGVAELSWHHVPEAVPNEMYEKQIVAKILK